MKNVFLIIFFICMQVLAFAQEKSEIILVIDPGHGGKDCGKLASKDAFMHEKELNMVIANKLGNYIESNLSHVKVYYTRTDDSYPSLTDRCDFANNKKADYFISIHCNGAESNIFAYGTETHINSTSNKKSHQLAQLIEKEFKSRAGRKSRGIKTSDDRHHSLQVLKETNMPSVLVETGFMSNIMEEKYLNTTYGQEILASAVFRAFRAFLQKNHTNINFTESEINEEEGPFYRIQIMSSIDKISTDIPEFKKIGEPVTRIKLNTDSMYKYKYTIGKSKEKKSVKKLLKKAKESGFEDAYIVRY